MSRIEIPHQKSLRLTLFFVLAGIITACGNDPFSQLISNRLKNDQGQNQVPLCPQALAVNSIMSVQSTKRKVRIGSDNFGDYNIQGFRPKKIGTGKRLVATFRENCLDPKSDHRLNYEEFALDSERSVDELEIEAQQNPCLIQITENFTYHVNMVSNDPSLTQQKHFDATRAASAFDVFYSPTSGITQDMVIAIIDSGVDIDHEDLKANIWHNSKEVASNGVDDDHNGFVDDVDGWNFAAHGGQAKNDPRPLAWEDDGDSATNMEGAEHGTHVAGLAAAVWNNAKGGSGIMGKNVKIMAINVFGDSASGSTTKLNQGILYAADNGADVINLSLGACGLDETTEQAILYAICKGATVVTAAGNTYYTSGGKLIGRELSDDRADANTSCDESAGNQKYFQTPASFGGAINGLITVGSADAIPNASGKYSKSDFSGWSATLVEIGAPGSQGVTAGLYSTYPDNSFTPNDLYGREEGTSMATPIVSGAVALARAYGLRKGVSMSPMSIEKLIKATGRHESLLDPYVKGGMHLDLLNLANEINSNINAYR